jgi:hypothetical protein
MGMGLMPGDFSAVVIRQRAHKSVSFWQQPDMPFLGNRVMIQA